MSNVTPLPKLIAWAPTTDEYRAMMSAILVAPTQVLTRDIYLSLLGDRIQRMVNQCEDPEEAAQTLQEDLFQAGLHPHVGRLPPSEAGGTLVESSMGVRGRLDSLHLTPEFPPPPLQEVPVARDQIRADRYDPLTRLRTWAGAISRLYL